MKKLNNKGITTIEVIISFVIVVIITASLYSTVSNYNQKRLLENYKSKIYTYKNTLTKEIQDDFIKIGLTHATYKNEHKNSSIVHTVECDLKDGTRRKLIVTQRFTDSTYHSGDPSVDDYFMIQYGNEEAGDLLDYPLPNVGQSLSDNNKVVYDLSINNVLINIEDDNVLSIYIGFYHPELMTRYGINIICPIDYISKGVDSSGKFNVVDPVSIQKRYVFHPNGGAGIISPIAATVGQPFEIPGKGQILRDGYTLDSWNSQPNGSGKKYEFNEIVVPTENESNITTLYAQWKKVQGAEYDVTYIVQKYTVPVTGKYRLEAWGAAGGGSQNPEISPHAGLGGYAMAEINLTEGEIIYVAVGGMGYQKEINDGVQHRLDVNDKVYGWGANQEVVSYGGYNGGGCAVGWRYEPESGTGGGATHFAKVDGEIIELDGKSDQIIIVAGGGGGSSAVEYNGSGGSGGGTISQSGFVEGEPGNYEASGADYYIGEGEWSDGYSGAGGGGLVGGYVSGFDYQGGGSGGTGYLNKNLIITGKMYCYGCPADADTISTIAYNRLPVSGSAKTGDGYAKITYIGA